MYSLFCNSSQFMKAGDDKNKAKLLQGVSPRRLRRTSRKHKSTCLEMIPPIPIPTTIIGEDPSERLESDRRRRQIRWQVRPSTFDTTSSKEENISKASSIYDQKTASRCSRIIFGSRSPKEDSIHKKKPPAPREETTFGYIKIIFACGSGNTDVGRKAIDSDSF